MLLATAAGCQSYNWQSDLATYQAAEERARQEGKHLFIFYKSWLDDASNRMMTPTTSGSIRAAEVED